MRVTNMMMSNRMLLNIHRNMARIDNIGQQMATQRRISFPSDNPILAARVLKLRNSLREAEQHQQNTHQGLGWMSATETAFGSANTINTTLRDLIQTGINGTNQLENRQAIVNQINQLFGEFGTLMNRQHAGRYIFSGFRTNHPPVFQADSNETFTIRQSFRFADIKNTSAVLRTGHTDAPQVIEGVRLLRLPFGGIEPGTFSFNMPGHNFSITEISRGADGFFPVGTYSPGADDIHFIYETGEIILGENVAQAMRDTQPMVTYTKTGFSSGELNPIIYFDTINAENLNVNNILGFSPAQAASLVNNLNSLHPSFETIEDMQNWVNYVISTYDEDSIPGPFRDLLGEIMNGNINYLNNTQLNELGVLNSSTAGHELRYEFSANTRIPVNSLALNILTPQLFSDLAELVRFIESLETSDEQMLFDDFRANPTNADLSDEEISVMVEAQLEQERGALNSAMQNRFNIMLGRLDNMHIQQSSRQEADLGSRINRLEMIQERLEAEVINFEELLNENEGISFPELASMLAAAEVAFNASLRASISVIQLTLADFLR